MVKNYNDGEYVFFQGDPADYIFAVKEGQVRLERSTIEGRSVSMHTAIAEETFAEAALFSKVYHCNAVALMPTVIHAYSKNQILKILTSNTDIALSYIRQLSSQVRSLRTSLELRNILSARDRIIQYLLLAAHPETGVVEFDKPLIDIAQELGLAKETLYRELSKMGAQGIIKREKNKIIITADMIQII